MANSCTENETLKAYGSRQLEVLLRASAAITYPYKAIFFFKIIKKILFRFKGWTMVFKAVSGVDRKVYPTYVSPQTSSEKNMAALDVTNKHKDHNKNRIVLKWSDFGASEVIRI